jgi:aminoglycoside phosphotransferase (APT) family kinase protein
MVRFGWLADPTADALRTAIAELAPELAGGTVEWRGPRMTPGRPGSRATAVIDGRYVAKVACSDRHAAAIHREGRVFQTLRDVGIGIPVPDVLAVGRDPALVITSLVPGLPLTADHQAVSRTRGQRAVGQELGRHLATLHRDVVTHAVVAASLDTVVPKPQAETDEIRGRFVALAPHPRRWELAAWCDWTDEVLAGAAPGQCFVHGDLHGHNELWDLDGPTLLAIVDLEQSGLADPHFDFRYLPAQAPSLALLEGAIGAYAAQCGWMPDIRRIMAWHIRTCLGDALWRTEADVALPDGGTIAQWLSTLSSRLSELGITFG